VLVLGAADVLAAVFAWLMKKKMRKDFKMCRPTTKLICLISYVVTGTKWWPQKN
jgi:hypothetical protein